MKNLPYLLVWIKTAATSCAKIDVAMEKLTFDSYYKESKGCENSLYDGDGIGIDHIMASGTLPELMIIER